MTAYIAIATVIIVAAIALASWFLHKKMAAEFDRLESLLHAKFEDNANEAHRTAMTVAETLHARLGEVDRSIRSHVVDEIDGLIKHVNNRGIDTQLHVTAEVSKVAADVRTHAAQAVHEAIGTVRGVKHETCQICGKVANIWKIVDGKIECADCSIRKLVS